MELQKGGDGSAGFEARYCRDGPESIKAEVKADLDVRACWRSRHFLEATDVGCVPDPGHAWCKNKLVIKPKYTSGRHLIQDLNLI